MNFKPPIHLDAAPDGERRWELIFQHLLREDFYRWRTVHDSLARQREAEFFRACLIKKQAETREPRAVGPPAAASLIASLTRPLEPAFLQRILQCQMAVPLPGPHLSERLLREHAQHVRHRVQLTLWPRHPPVIQHGITSLP